MPEEQAKHGTTHAIASRPLCTPRRSGVTSTARANHCEARKAIDLRQDIFIQKEPRPGSAERTVRGLGAPHRGDSLSDSQSLVATVCCAIIRQLCHGSREAAARLSARLAISPVKTWGSAIDCAQFLATPCVEERRREGSPPPPVRQCWKHVASPLLTNPFRLLWVECGRTQSRGALA